MLQRHDLVRRSNSIQSCKLDYLFSFYSALKGNFCQTNPIFSNKINGSSFRDTLETTDLENTGWKISPHFGTRQSPAMSSKARYRPLRRASVVTVPKTGDRRCPRGTRWHHTEPSGPGRFRRHGLRVGRCAFGAFALASDNGVLQGARLS